MGNKIKPPKTWNRRTRAVATRTVHQIEARMPVMDRDEEAYLLGEDDGVMLFLDDERPCPPGWRHAKDLRSFLSMLGEISPGKLRALSLDWYLGAGVTSGIDAACEIALRIENDPTFFSGLKRVHCHSSDREKAVEMARIIESAAQEFLEERVRFRLGLPG